MIGILKMTATTYLIKSKCKTSINIMINGEIFVIPPKPQTREVTLRSISEDLQKLIDSNIIKISIIN